LRERSFFKSTACPQIRAGSGENQECGYFSIRPENPEAAKILQERGYCPMMPEQCLARLMERLKDADEFPHEIGLFLGYPPEDVEGFIQEPNGQKYTGIWKVYGDVRSARRIFESYKKCTEVYCRQFFSGVSLEKLAVAG
jgi:hypothetical protein